MKFTSALLSMAVAGAMAAPTLEARQTSVFTPKALPNGKCLCDSEALAIVNAFKWVLANPTDPAFEATANALFGSGFIDTSESINQLISTTDPSVDVCLLRLIQIMTTY
jgi:hypothetical protein